MKRLTTYVAALAIAVSATACSQTDSGVTTKVKAKFAQDDIVKAHDINVTTRDGVVTLSGEVDSSAARERAVSLARATEGVTNVIDDLQLDVTATTGDRDDIDVEVDGEVEEGVHETGEAIHKGADAAADAARKAGNAVRDAVTDNDRDSDRDGK